MKIDTTQIPNFDNLPDDAKKAILGMEFADAPDMSQFVSKSVFDKKASEASELSKQLRSRMTEDEAKALKAAEEREALEARVKELEHERAVNGYMASYTAMGYDEKLARSSAEALAKGDTATVFANQKIHAENREKALKVEWLKGTPRPTGGNDPKIDYNKKIEEAQASGDFTAVAYYTRLSAQEASANDE